MQTRAKQKHTQNNIGMILLTKQKNIK